MPHAPPLPNQGRARKGRPAGYNTQFDEDDRTDYRHGNLDHSRSDLADEETGATYEDALDTAQSPFQKPDSEHSVSPKQKQSPKLQPSPKRDGPRTEVPLEEYIVPSKKKDDNITKGYEMITSPQHQVRAIDNAGTLTDLTKSVTSDGDESWEHIDSDLESTNASNASPKAAPQSTNSPGKSDSETRKPYAQVVRDRGEALRA